MIDGDDIIYAGNPVGFGDATPGNGIGFSGGIEQRHGRVAVKNAFGSELLDLAVPSAVEYLNGSGHFVANGADACTDLSLSLSDVSPTDNLNVASDTCVWDGGSPGASAAGCAAAGPAGRQYAEPPAAGSFNLFLKAPGTGKTGSADIVLDAPSWLKFDWYGVGEQDPVTRATFGIYSGAPGIVQMREPWN